MTGGGKLLSDFTDKICLYLVANQCVWCPAGGFCDIGPFFRSRHLVDLTCEKFLFLIHTDRKFQEDRLHAIKLMWEYEWGKMLFHQYVYIFTSLYHATKVALDWLDCHSGTMRLHSINRLRGECVWFAGLTYLVEMPLCTRLCIVGV